MKNTVIAVLVAGALALSAGGSTLAAGKLGGAGGMDEFAISLADGTPDGSGDANEDRPTTQGGKIGDGTNGGDD